MKLQHPESDLTVDATPDTAPMYASQGWREIPKTTAKKAAEPTKGSK